MCCGKKSSNKGRSRKIKKVTPPIPPVKKEEKKS
jgi:hypothetical protein